MPVVILWLVIASLFFTFRLGVPQLRFMRASWQLIRGDFDDPRAPGEITHRQALSAALSVTVGLGNISGVAIAISIGGPGATLWMMVAGFLGMATKYAECTLGVRYRRFEEGSKVIGGPMVYIKDGLADIGMTKLGAILATFIALVIMATSFVSTNMYQVNQLLSQITVVTGGQQSAMNDYGWVLGLSIALLVWLVISGGVGRVGKATEKIVPVMTGIYVLGCVTVVLVNIDNLLESIVVILNSAFSLESATGGMWGAMTQGFVRAVISSEAGMGTAAIAHAAAKTRYPAAEGHVALLEPFIDTVVICSLTSLVIVTSGVYSDTSLEGVKMTSAAFASVLPWFPVVLAFAIFMFAFSTILVTCYYGMQCASMLFGEGKQFVRKLYLAMFLCLIVAATFIELGTIVTLMDSLIVLICIPNVISLYLLSPIIAEETKLFRSKYNRKQLPLSLQKAGLKK